MNPETWQRLEDVFLTALEVSPEERGAFLERACAGDEVLRAEVDAMLAAHTTGTRAGAVDALLRHSRETGTLPPAVPIVGARVGAYRIVELIGRGGMGEVYRAQRDDDEYHQHVALKLVRPGLGGEEIVRRFRIERQILAWLEHPGITALLDGGVTGDGRPYLVMQYVRGDPITAYADAQRLTIRERLQLFRTVCEAVQFAHANLVVHRDLKPSNILVTAEGQVRLLDFGIAKLLDPNRSGVAAAATEDQRLLTPEHAAPEQLLGRAITTATDVYALGVLLYELLTGVRPFGAASPLDLQRAVIETEALPPSAALAVPAAARREADRTAAPPDLVPVAALRSTRPQALLHQLRGDLDAIVLQALRKEPERRYASAGQLAEDVARYLEGRPVIARADTLRYRARKFAARNRTLVGAAALVVLLLVGFAATASLQARRVAQERDRAERERGSAEAAVGFLVELFERANPQIVPGADTLRVAALLEEGERQVDALAEQPAVQARMWRVLGNMHAARSRYQRATELLRRSYERQRELWGADDPGAAQTYHELARTTYFFRGGTHARPMLDSSVARLRRAVGEDDPLLAGALLDLALATEELDEQRALLDRSLAIRRRAPGTTPVDLAASLHALASERYARREYTAAATLFGETQRILEGQLARDHPHRLTVASNHAKALAELAEWERAEAISREVVALHRSAAAPDSAALASALEGWALLRVNQGAFAEAEAALREVLVIERAVFPAEHWLIDNTLRNLAMVRAASGGVAEGLAALDSVITRVQARGETDSRLVGYFYGQRALLLLRLGRTAEAARAADVGDRIIRATTPLGDGTRAHADAWVAAVALARADAATALQRFESAHTLLASQIPPTHPRLAGMECGMGAALLALGRRAEAEPLLRHGCPIHERWPMGDPMLTLWGGDALHRLARDGPRS